MTLFHVYATVLGLLLGSFLNVVAMRYPPRLFWTWRRDALDYLELPPQTDPIPPSFVFKSSACPHCATPIRWYDNIPLLGFAALRGRCRSCKTKISWRYPLIELAMGALALAAYQVSPDPASAVVLTAFFAVLLTATVIDFDTQIIPDDIVLPALWAVLLAAAFGLIPVSLKDAVIGAAAGYLSLWTVFHGFKLATGKEGMGYGDFKMLALIGAFLGPSAILPVIMMSAIAGSVIGIALLARESQSRPFAFGPFLAMGAVLFILLRAPICNLLTVCQP